MVILSYTYLYQYNEELYELSIVWAKINYRNLLRRYFHAFTCRGKNFLCATVSSEASDLMVLMI